MYDLNLEIITEDGSNKLTSLGGKDNGLAAAAKTDIVNLVKNNDVVRVIIPEYIKGFHSSFFAGMFSQVIADLGNKRENFEEKIVFVANDKILEQILEGIDLCFMDTSAVKIKK